jgi:hypothetical protein
LPLSAIAASRATHEPTGYQQPCSKANRLSENENPGLSPGFVLPDIASADDLAKGFA